MNAQTMAPRCLCLTHRCPWASQTGRRSPSHRAWRWSRTLVERVTCDV
uniref:Alternative protein PRDM11 n=1 Tax=Homo sapiens TaxID=9606 RepID=L8E8J9_HUMAN|nr:alternative protein PRDM11 [Homo sapiens]